MNEGNGYQCLVIRGHESAYKQRTSCILAKPCLYRGEGNERHTEYDKKGNDLATVPGICRPAPLISITRTVSPRAGDPFVCARVLLAARAAALTSRASSTQMMLGTKTTNPRGSRLQSNSKILCFSSGLVLDGR